MIKVIMKNMKFAQNCREKCDLYDDITGRCSVLVEVDLDESGSVSDCQYFLSKNDESNMSFGNVEHLGQPANEIDNWLYPFYPDSPSQRNDAIWFVSPCHTYACWIINHSKQKFVSVNLLNSLEESRMKRTYKFPHPLHDHKAPPILASKMVWYIDKTGYGCYMLLDKGELIRFK